MGKNTQLKAIVCGVVLAALVSARPALGQGTPCDFESDFLLELPEASASPCLTNTFSPGLSTNKYDFGNGHAIKITATVVTEFDLAIEFVPITNEELAARLNEGLGPAECVRYDGATSNTSLGSCGFYHVVNPPDPSFYTGDVLYRVLWDFPTLDQLHNVRLYRAPIPEEDEQTCDDGSNCYTKDITGTVLAVGDSGSDPGVDGKSKKFSDYEVVDLTSPTSTAARVWIGLKKSNDAGIRFDLKAVVKKNGIEVSSGTLFGAPGGGKGFNNANLLTIPLSLPAEEFHHGDDISIKLFVRNSCLASPQNSGSARLWYNDATANSRFDEPGAPTLYLVRGNDDGEEDCDHDEDGGDLSKYAGNGPKKKKNVKVNAPVPSCDGPYKAFGKWSGKVPY